MTADIQFTGAMKVTDWLDLGLGVDAQYTDAKLQTASNRILSPLLPDGISQLSGNGWNYGWTVGAQAKFDRLTSGRELSLSGGPRRGRTGLRRRSPGPARRRATWTLDGSASFTTPWIATVGARWRVTDQLTLDAQLQHFGWSEFDAIHVTTAGGNQTLAQDYKDTTSGAVGADYAVNDRLTLRAGVQFDPTPTPDGERTARVPDGDRWLYGVGATGKIGERTQVDAAFAYIDFANSDVSHDTVFYAGTPAATSTALRGSVEGSGYVISQWA